MALTNLGGSGQTVALDSAGINNVHQQLTDSIKNLRDSVRAIDDAAQACTRTGWVGEAADAFTKVATVWHDETTDLNNRFDRFSAAVEEGSTHLQKMDANHG
ncbi:WXG100 family type VII secretion target [Nocardia sp. NPDC046473]|uniref:WXG100 family type VII secretion target n=1 Tax=Nocardia sp. NPDC046473 TaxID=3155733 RepID=UPI0033E359A7